MQTVLSPTTHNFLSGGGEMGTLIRGIDWSTTPIGAVDEWPQSLRTAISIMLNAQFPMYIAWGEQFIQFYNDGYRPILGSTKHPAAMGSSTKITFAEIWDIIGPMFEGVMEGKAVGFTDFLLPMDRHGFTEECYFIFSYSPIKQENGLTGGVLVTVTETSARVLGERRLKSLRDLGDRSVKCKNIPDAASCLLQAIDTNRFDIPFSILYLHDPSDDSFRCAGSTGINPAGTGMPDVDDVKELATSMPLRSVPIDSILPSIQYGDLPWQELPQYCCATFLTRPDQKNPFGILLLGISARLRYDHHYENFYKLLTDQAVTALSNANAFEEEIKRAEALAEIDRAKTAFFSNISHEFRTPLTLMLGPLEELLQTKGGMTDREIGNAETAHRNAIRLLRLVNSLLDFSRIEAGRMQAVFRPADITTMTKDLASNFRSVIEKAGLQLLIECDPVQESVYVDYGMWEKIVLNLLSNAFKYTLDGVISVTLNDSGEHIVLKVKDTGVGIPENELPHMFERFHRISNSAGRTYEGTGIGLSLVYELVKLHKGDISVQSRLGEGSLFSVSIPKGYSHLPPDKVLHRADKLAVPSATESYLKDIIALSRAGAEEGISDVDSSGIHHKKDACVLIADDNEDMLNYLKRLLENNYRVVTAPNGAVALKKAADTNPDLIISDIMMPVMDGVQLLKQIKADRSTADIPVMLLSARAGEESKIEGYDLGADDYLIKPFSSKELLAKVKSQIQLARTRSHLSTLLKNVFEQTPAAITIIRKENYTIEFANDLYLQLVDKGADFIGKSIFESLPELKNQGIQELLDNVIATGTPYLGRELEVLLNRQGRRDKTYFNFIYHPLKEQDGSVTGVIVVCFEVTALVMARKRAEESEVLLEAKVKERTAQLESKNNELKQQKDFIETILNASVDIVTVLDKDLRYIMVDKKFEELYNQKADNVIGKHILEIFPGVENSAFYRFLREAVDGKSGYTKDYYSIVTGRLYELYTVPLKNDDEVYAIVSIAHDNTDVIESARRLEDKNNILSKINEDLEQFAYVASHDLQEPLRKIRTFASLLEKNIPSDAGSARYFEKIHSSAERMSRLIRDLLNFSRLSGTQITFEVVDLNEILESVISDFELLVAEKECRIEYSRLPVVKGIKLQFHQLFSNLINNALKFSSAHPVIDISHRIISAEEYARFRQPVYHRSYLEVIFSDNGIGFDQKYADHVFTIFKRLHEKETTGTGIGLALCKKITENHKGFIRVESMPGVGSTFFVYLPLGA